MQHYHNFYGQKVPGTATTFCTGEADVTPEEKQKNWPISKSALQDDANPVGLDTIYGQYCPATQLHMPEEYLNFITDKAATKAMIREEAFWQRANAT